MTWRATSARPYRVEKAAARSQRKRSHAEDEEDYDYSAMPIPSGSIDGTDGAGSKAGGGGGGGGGRGGGGGGKGVKDDGGGRGLHSFAFWINLSMVRNMCTSILSQKRHNLSCKVDECKPLGGGGRVREKRPRPVDLNRLSMDGVATLPMQTKPMATSKLTGV